jgi:hypothetical protein
MRGYFFMKLLHNTSLRNFILLLALLFGSNSAFAWTWGEVIGEVAKGVVIGVIVDTITKPSSSAKEQPSPSPSPVQPQYINPSPQYSNPTTDYTSLVSIALSHFQADSQCNIGNVMSFYSSIVHYDGEDITKDEVKDIKIHSCKRYSENPSYSIRDNNVTISDFSKDSNVKLVDYNVDFDVYSKKKRKRIKGVTNVRLIVRDNKIIGESHKVLTRY